MKVKKNKKTFFFGLLNKRERWGLSWKGWLLGFFTSICFFIFIFKNIYSFLAPTTRVDTKTLVVEGWLGDYELQLAAEEFKERNYDHIYVTGGPIETGGFLTKYKNYAQLGLETLLKIGIPSQKITAVPAPKTLKDRSYNSALALKKYFEEKNLGINSFNILSGGPHSRRSHLLFELAFNSKPKIGIIASESDEIENTHSWWSSSAGFRSVLGELIAYLYALFFKYAKPASL